MGMICGKSGVLFLLLGTAVWLAPSVAAEDDPVYGPRFEVGAGLERIMEKNQPEWAAESANRGMGTISMRVFRGLAIQMGLDYGGGGDPRADSLALGGSQVPLNEDSFSNSLWAGVRYELPMSVLNQDILGIYSVYGGAGMCWAKYGVSSSETATEGEVSRHSYTLASLRGPYALLGIRWRIDAGDQEKTTSWLGAYGVDVGAKYVRYGESDLRYSGIEKPSGTFSSTQIFAVGFIKFDVTN